MLVNFLLCFRVFENNLIAFQADSYQALAPSHILEYVDSCKKDPEKCAAFIIYAFSVRYLCKLFRKGSCIKIVIIAFLQDSIFEECEDSYIYQILNMPLIDNVNIFKNASQDIYLGQSFCKSKLSITFTREIEKEL